MSDRKENMLHSSEVHDLSEIAPGVWVLTFGKCFDFHPGQLLGLSVSPLETQRLYSIASGSGENRFMVLFNVMEEGFLTPRLATLKKGDIIYVSGPYGRFFGSADPAYWIASGTGIAPFISMYLSGLSAGKVLIHGGRNRDSFYFQDELKTALGDNYFRCCSGQDIPGLFHGRLTKFLSMQNQLPAGHLYYLCGRSEMVVEARDILILKGIPFANILSEIYF